MKSQKTNTVETNEASQPHPAQSNVVISPDFPKGSSKKYKIIITTALLVLAVGAVGAIALSKIHDQQQKNQTNQSVGQNPMKPAETLELDAIVTNVRANLKPLLTKHKLADYSDSELKAKDSVYFGARIINYKPTDQEFTITADIENKNAFVVRADDLHINDGRNMNVDGITAREFKDKIWKSILEYGFKEVKFTDWGHDDYDMNRQYESDTSICQFVPSKQEFTFACAKKEQLNKYGLEARPLVEAYAKKQHVSLRTLYINVPVPVEASATPGYQRAQVNVELRPTPEDINYAPRAEFYAVNGNWFLGATTNWGLTCAEYESNHDMSLAYEGVKCLVDHNLSDAKYSKVKAR